MLEKKVNRVSSASTLGKWIVREPPTPLLVNVWIFYERTQRPVSVPRIYADTKRSGIHLTTLPHAFRFQD
jgi:hypothetical protein